VRLMRHHAAAIGIAVVVALDLTTKRVIEGVLSSAPHSIPVTPFFNLTLRYNRGISFSLFASDNPYMPFILASVSLLVATAFTIWLLRTDNGYAKLGLSLIVGGAVGNALDRLDDGAVTDFLYFYAGAYRWPAFNLADIAIACGLVFLLAEPGRRPREKRS